MKRQRKLLEQQLRVVESGSVEGDRSQSSTSVVPIDDCEFCVCVRDIVHYVSKSVVTLLCIV